MKFENVILWLESLTVSIQVCALLEYTNLCILLNFTYVYIASNY